MVKCWRKKLNLAKVEASEGGEEMVSIDKYFDKFAYRREEEYRVAVEENEGNRRCFFGLNWRI